MRDVILSYRVQSGKATRHCRTHWACTSPLQSQIFLSPYELHGCDVVVVAAVCVSFRMCLASCQGVAITILNARWVHAMRGLKHCVSMCESSMHACMHAHDGFEWIEAFLHLFAKLNPLLPAKCARTC